MKPWCACCLCGETISMSDRCGYFALIKDTTMSAKYKYFHEHCFRRSSETFFDNMADPRTTYAARCTACGCNVVNFNYIFIVYIDNSKKARELVFDESCFRKYIGREYLDMFQ